MKKITQIDIKEEYILEILKELLKFLIKNYFMTFIIIIWNIVHDRRLLYVTSGKENANIFNFNFYFDDVIYLFQEIAGN